MESWNERRNRKEIGQIVRYTHTDTLNIDKKKKKTTKEKEIENLKGGIEKDTKQKFIRNMNTYKC